MNRRHTLIWGRHVAAPSCQHTECTNLRQIRAQLAAAGMWPQVNIAERELAQCPDQPGQEWVR